MKTEPTEALRAKANDLKYNVGVIHSNPQLILEESFISGVRYGQSNPNIKQLEWIESEDGKCLHGIAIYAGYYHITSTSEGAWMRIATAGIRKRFDTVDEAKAAAQADFERRVMECIISE